jgi:hypothetical protein
MNDTPQRRAVRKYRQRLKNQGMARFEVFGLKADRHLIRSLARRIADQGPEARTIRDAVERSISGTTPKKGSILTALRRSPLVGADLDFGRSVAVGRKVDL